MVKDGDVEQLAAELYLLECKRQCETLTEPENQRRSDLTARLMAHLHQRAEAERRRYLRIPADLEVRFRMSGATITCSAYEIGYGGIGLRGHLWIVEDQEITVENLRLGHRDYPTTLRSKVVWKSAQETSPPGAGLEFVNVNESDRRQLRTVMEHLFLAYLRRISGGVDIPPA